MINKFGLGIFLALGFFVFGGDMIPATTVSSWTSSAPTAQLTENVATTYEQQNLWERFAFFVIGRDHVAQAQGVIALPPPRFEQPAPRAPLPPPTEPTPPAPPRGGGGGGCDRDQGRLCWSYNSCGMRNGGTIECDGSCSATPPSDAACPPPTYTITASAGPGGSISPNGHVPLSSGSSRQFTITPNPGRSVLEVIVDGRDVGAVTSYLFSSVTSNHTISVSFSRASCPSGVSRTWSAHGHSCSGTTPATGDGLLGSITDSTGQDTGSAQYLCRDGSWDTSPQSGQTCSRGGTPDLLSRFSASPIASGSLIQGQAVTFTGTTSNQGIASVRSEFSDSFEYCWGAGCTPTTPLSHTHWPSLDPGLNYSETSIPLSLVQSGTLRVSYCADKPPAISESDESNNCEVRSFTVNPPVAPQPNLTISQATGGITVNNPPGIRFSSIVYNSDAQTAPGQNIWSDVEIDWNNTTNCSSASADTSRTTGGPWSGVGYASPGSINWSAGVFADYFPGELQNGTHCFRHRVDQGGMVTESNDSDNNGPWRRLTITGLPVAQPNLVPNPLSQLTANGALTQGGNVTFTDWVYSTNGTSTPTGFTDSFRYCWGGGCTPGTMIGGHIAQGVLTGSATRSDTSASLSLSNLGTLRVQYCVDSQSQIAESNESDNCRTRDFTVGPVVVPSHTVTITAGPGGTASPIGVITVPDGTMVPRIWFQPFGSNTVQTVVSNGFDFGPLSYMDLGYIGIDRTVHVTFNIIDILPPCDGSPATAGPQVVTASVSGGPVWGIGPFTSDSNFPKIARYLGANEGWTATLNVTPVGCVSSFSSGTANGVTTSPFGAPWYGMNVFLVRQDPPVEQSTLKICEFTGIGWLDRAGGSLTPLTVGGTVRLKAVYDSNSDCSGAAAVATWAESGFNAVSLAPNGNERTVTATNQGSETISVSVSGITRAVTVSVTCTRTAQCTDAGATATAANTCVGSSFNISDACGTYSCDGARSCDYNWKEVAP